MPYVAIVHATFDSKADADHIYDQAKAVATTASVTNIGTEQERTSHAYVAEEQSDGSQVIDREWHIDLFGIVREGEPDLKDAPDWIQPEGSHDAYPAQNVRGKPSRVTHKGDVWVNTHGDGNVWEPGASGWTLEEEV